MNLKRSNLCLSADVSTAQQLLSLATSLGPSIVVLKTHYDLISNWDYHPSTGTGLKLQRIARKYGFLVFEDRKLGDIGHTVQQQYIGGTARICDWANICNVNMIPGKAVIGALAEAESIWREKGRYRVDTDISVGTPRAEYLDSDGEDSDDEEDTTRTPIPERGEREPSMERGLTAAQTAGRKASIVSITTVSQHFEPVNSPRLYTHSPSPGNDEDEEVFQGLEEAPLERGMLILAQMSSEGNFMTKEYTMACVEAAREHPSFVMGFIAQESLNTQPHDHFLSLTPGCQLPPEGEDGEVKGDGKGQQYNTPAKIIGLGNDVVIVGRGIIKAADPRREAERYRRAAWEAYERRLGST